MKNITLRIIQDITKGQLTASSEQMGIEISEIVSDSRKITKNCVFLCIKGEKVDGHAFAQTALDQGAALVICEQNMPELKGPWLLVESVLKATQAIAAYYRKMLDVKVVGVTGSVGKTSTKEFVAAVLSKRFRVLKTQGNQNNHWGVPFTIFRMDENTQAAVVEMGIDHPGEMDELANIVRPDAAIITNIGDSHLENFKTREGTLKAKAEIFKYMKSTDHIILNGDDPLLRSIDKVNGIRPEFCGIESKCPLMAEHIVDKGARGSEFDLVLREGGGKLYMRIKLPLSGEHNIRNALVAAQVGMDMGISLPDIKSALESLKAPEGRGNIIDTERFSIINHCYNASPASMKAAINELKGFDDKYQVAILGDMLELGTASEKAHFDTGKFAVEAEIDMILCVGPSSEKIYLGAKMCDAIKASDLKKDENHSKWKKKTQSLIRYFKTREDCMNALPELLKKIDNAAILVKASNAMGFSRLVEQLKDMK